MPPYARKFFRWPLLAGGVVFILLITLAIMPDRPWTLWALLALVIMTPLLTVLPWLAFFGLQQRLDAAKGQLCPGCGHDLNGTPQPGRCPECGRSFDTAELRETWRHLHGQP